MTREDIIEMIKLLESPKVLYYSKKILKEIFEVEDDEKLFFQLNEILNSYSCSYTTQRHSIKFYKNVSTTSNCENHCIIY